ncbi:MAG: c-type cytochrome [Pseudomonadota bacterium]
MKKIAVAAVIGLLSLSVSAYAVDPKIKAKYDKTCTFCHATGAAGAPKTGDAAAWKPRLAKGDAALLKSVKNGFNAMPPKGMCNDCTDADYKALIQYNATGK